MSLEKDKKQSQSLIDIEKKRLLYFIKDEAEVKYKRFKKSRKKCREILYAGDFVLDPNKENNYGKLELMLPSETPTTIDYITVFRSLLQVFDLDRDSNDVEVGTGTSFPEVNTKNLSRFTKEHPDVKLKTEYMYFGLISSRNEQRMIIRTRYFDPETKEPLTEVWEAIKYIRIG